METNIFDRFFKRTLWSEKTPAPTYDELISMENDFMEALLVMKTSGDYQVYRYHFSQKGKQVIARIGFYLRALDANPENADIRRLRDSYTRLREALKSLDRRLYESELRADIQKGKRIRVQRQIEQSKTIEQEHTEEYNAKEKSTQTKAPYLRKANIPFAKLESLCHALIKKGWLHECTNVADFIYYLSGIGDEPTEQLVWKGDLVILSIFIAEIEGYEKPEWSKVARIFRDTTAASMKSLFCTSKNKSVEAFYDNQEKIQDLIDAL